MKIKFLTVLILFAIITACSIDNETKDFCAYQAPMATTVVEGPDSTTVNTPVNLNVSFYIGNSCGTFNSFQTSTGYPKSVVAVVDYAGCTCSTESFIQIKPYTFTASAAGTYELRFVTEDEDAPIVKTITVTAE